MTSLKQSGDFQLDGRLHRVDWTTGHPTVTTPDTTDLIAKLIDRRQAQLDTEALDVRSLGHLTGYCEAAPNPGRAAPAHDQFSSLQHMMAAGRQGGDSHGIRLKYDGHEYAAWVENGRVSTVRTDMIQGFCLGRFQQSMGDLFARRSLTTRATQIKELLQGQIDSRVEGKAGVREKEIRDLVRRARAAETRPDLSGRDLSGLDLGGMDLHDADLSRANLKGTNLKGANLTSAQLNETNLQDANLSGAVLDKIQMKKTDLRGANLMFAMIKPEVTESLNAENANFSGATLEGSFSKANFVKADLSRTRMRNCGFDEARMTGTDFSHASIYKIDFRSADLRDTKFANANIDEAHFEHASVRGARLAEATLEYFYLGASGLKDGEIVNPRGKRGGVSDFLDVLSDVVSVQKTLGKNSTRGAIERHGPEHVAALQAITEKLGALLVPPSPQRGFAQAIHRSLSGEERAEAMRTLATTLTRCREVGVDLTPWTPSLLEALSHPEYLKDARILKLIEPLAIDNLKNGKLEDLRKSPAILPFLLKNSPALLDGNSETVFQLLLMCKDPDLHFRVMADDLESGRSLEALTQQIEKNYLTRVYGIFPGLEKQVMDVRKVPGNGDVLPLVSPCGTRALLFGRRFQEASRKAVVPTLPWDACYYYENGQSGDAATLKEKSDKERSMALEYVGMPPLPGFGRVAAATA